MLDHQHLHVVSIERRWWLGFAVLLTFLTVGLPRRALLAQTGVAAATVNFSAEQEATTVTYTISITNSGTQDLNTLALQATVPQNGAFRRQEITPLGAVPAGYVIADAAAEWNIDVLSAGQTLGPFTYQVDVPAGADPVSLAAHAVLQWQAPVPGSAQSADATPQAQPSGGVPVTPETPDGTTLRPTADADGIKRVTLTAEQVDQEILNADGKRVVAEAYGFNGGTPGPTLAFTIGDQVAITVVNHLPEATSVHWHGVIVPNAMDGVPEAGEPSPSIAPGDSFTYQFTVQQTGTHMYHSHTDAPKQDLLGLAGALIFLPLQETSPHVDHDYVYFLNEWSLPQQMTPAQIVDMPRTGSPVDTVNSVTAQPDWATMNFNFFTMNGKAFPSTSPIDVEVGERIRIRFFQIGMSTHPMHFHGQDFLHTEQDGNAISPDNQQQLNTITVAPGQTQVVEFYAVNPGVWPLHCHLAHHQANNFSSGLGGMATVVRISQ